MALVLQDAAAGAEPAKVDEWVAEELKKEKIGAASILRPWFYLTTEAVTIHDTKLYGRFTVQLDEPSDAEAFSVVLAGSSSQRIPLPRKDGTTKLVRHELANHLGEKLAFYLALRVEKAGAGASQLLEVGSDANGKTLTVTGVPRVLISLPGNETTGYGWSVGRIEGEAVQADGSVQYISNPSKPGMVGVGGTFKTYFRAMAKGKATVTMEYRRPWEKDKPAEKTFTVTLDVQDVK
jgi:inhibitor of cysteine peptidase